MNKNEVIQGFIADPNGFTEHLIRSNALRHEARLWLGEFLLENPDPAYAEFSWIFLMPWYLSIDFTEGACNLDCRMCCGKESRAKGKFRYVSRQQFRKILTYVPTAGTVSLPSNSSDPLMNPDFLEVLDIMNRCRLSFNTVCNGHLLKPKIIQALAEYPNHVEFNVSIDSCDPVKYREIRKGELQPVLENLLALRTERDSHPQSGLSINVMMVGMEDNINELPQMMEFCRKIGADKCKVQHLTGDVKPGDFMRNPNWVKAVFEALIEARRHGVQLIVPKDALLVVESRLPELVSGQVPDGRVAEIEKSSVPPEENSIPSKDPVAVDQVLASEEEGVRNEMKTREHRIICSRFDNLHIRFDGWMAPCCHVNYPTPLNIYTGPVYKNMDFLRYRLQLFRGEVFDACHGAVNCHCMQEQRFFRR